VLLEAQVANPGRRARVIRGRPEPGLSVALGAA